MMRLWEWISGRGEGGREADLLEVWTPNLEIKLLRSWDLEPFRAVDFFSRRGQIRSDSEGAGMSV